MLAWEFATGACALVRGCGDVDGDPVGVLARACAASPQQRPRRPRVAPRPGIGEFARRPDHLGVGGGGDHVILAPPLDRCTHGKNSNGASEAIASQALVPTTRKGEAAWPRVRSRCAPTAERPASRRRVRGAGCFLPHPLFQLDPGLLVYVRRHARGLLQNEAALLGGVEPVAGGAGQVVDAAVVG